MAAPARRALCALVACLTLLSCEARRAGEPPTPETPPGPPGVAASAGIPPTSAPERPGPATTDGTPLPPRFPATGILVSATAVEPAARLPLDPASESVVDPGASFEVVLAARVADARLVLLDAQDAQVAARGTIEVGRRTTLALAPASPLVPASRYVLRLEGAVERNLHDATDRTFEPLSFALLAAGDPPPAAPPRRSRRRRR